MMTELLSKNLFKKIFTYINKLKDRIGKLNSGCVYWCHKPNVCTRVDQQFSFMLFGKVIIPEPSNSSFSARFSKQPTGIVMKVSLYFKIKISTGGSYEWKVPHG